MYSMFNIEIPTGVCQSHHPHGSRHSIKAMVIAVTEKGVRVQKGEHLSNVSGFAFSLNVCVEAVNKSDSIE